MSVQPSDSVSCQKPYPVYIPPPPKQARDVLPDLRASSADVIESLASQADQSNLVNPKGPATENPLSVQSPSPEKSCDYQQDWNLKVSHVWGIDFHQVTMEQTLQLVDDIIRVRKPTYAVTANLNYAMLCDQSSRLREFTQRAGLVLCDGMPILWRSRWNKIKLPERVAGADLIFKLAEQSQKKGHRIYLFGAAEGVAEKTALELKRLYPGCKIVGYQCPPFRAPTESELRSQIDNIRKAQPDILLVALGQPKGEYWIEDYLHVLQVPLCIQLGASFDFVAGTAKRAPKLFQRTGLEWLYRALSDPKRLIPRYFKNALFLAKFIRNDLISVLDDKR